MMVYIYERLTENVNHFVNPRAGHASINISYYVSNGYLVLTPDIVYTTGLSGPERAQVRAAGVRRWWTAALWTKRPSAYRATVGAATRWRTW
jgi:hypothetical protein